MVIHFPKLPDNEKLSVEMFVEKWCEPNPKQAEQRFDRELSESEAEALIGEYDAKFMDFVGTLLKDEYGISTEAWEKLQPLLDVLGGLEEDVDCLRHCVQAINGRFCLPE